MKEILEIIDKHLDVTSGFIETKGLAFEIETLIKENYVEKEFVEYIVTHKDLEISLGLKSAYQYWLEHPELQKTK
jgi:hypothetical protein